jgi:hypothetical protein
MKFTGNMVFCYRGSWVFISDLNFSIPDPGSGSERQDPDPQIIFTMLLEICSGMFIAEPRSRIRIFHSGSRGQRSTGFQIRICNTTCGEADDFPLYFTNVDDCCCGAGCVTRCSGGALCACPASPLMTPTWKPRGATRPRGCPPLTPVSHFVLSSDLPCSFRFSADS